MTSAELLGIVLARARATLDISPEAVGERAGVHGRTIRRLEEHQSGGAPERPRRTTLQTLARFYGLNADVLMQLAAWSAEGLVGDGLEEAVWQLAEDRQLADGLDEAMTVADVAMRLARARRGTQAAGGPGQRVNAALAQLAERLGQLRGKEQDQVLLAVLGLAYLSDARRRLVVSMVEELLSAQQITFADDRQLGALGDRAMRLFEESPEPTLFDAAE